MGTLNPTGGQNLQASRPKGRVIPFGKYLLLERLAVGGMAEVFLAKSFGVEGFEKLIAIKRILPTMAEDQEFIEMFIDEAKIAGHLAHANIVPIYELGKIGDAHYIAMEFVWGKDLLQIMNRFRRLRKHMPAIAVAWIASKICEGLDYAHAKRSQDGGALHLIHRDVSPQNVLVSYDGHVKLIDFGIARAASRTTRTHAGVLKGKFGYMSPEQVRGLPIDHRSDIFAVGTCMYEMLTSERLFIGESDFSTLERVRNADVQPPSKFVPEVPREMDAIVMKALACEVADRYQTAAELQAELQQFLTREEAPFSIHKLAAWMRSAFAAEFAQERARLDSYATIGRPSLLTDPAAQRSSLNGLEWSGGDTKTVSDPSEPSLEIPITTDSDADEEEDRGDETIVTSPLFEHRSEIEEISEQPTEIFFSATELESSPLERDTGQEKLPSHKRETSVDSHPRETPASSSELAGSAAEESSLLKSSEVTVAVRGAHLSVPPRAKPKVAKVIVSLAACLILLVGGASGAYWVLRPHARTVIEVRTDLISSETEIRIDGVRWGRPPVYAEVSPGLHHVELRTGPRALRRKVSAIEGASTMVDFVVSSHSGFTDEASRVTPKVVIKETAAPPLPRPAVADRSDEHPRRGRPRPTRAPGRNANLARQEEKEEEGHRASAEEQKEPEPTGSEAAEESSNDSREQGTLVVNTLPVARVFLDGRDTRRVTPVMSLRVPPGTHRLELHTGDQRVHSVVVDVPPGETVKVIRRLF